MCKAKVKQTTKNAQRHFFCNLKACGNVGALRPLHDQIIKDGSEIIGTLENTLIDMYAKLGALDEAEKMFELSSKACSVPWNAIIDGYVRHGYAHQGVKLFQEMRVKGIKPSKVTYLCTLRACGKLTCVDQGEVVHNEIIVVGIKLDAVLGSTLIDMYGKCKMLAEAHKIFGDLTDKDVVSWNTLILGYSQQGQANIALELFHAMQDNGINPTGGTLVCILKACGTIGAVVLGRLIHASIIETSYNVTDALDGALIAMYTECLSFCDACKVFNSALSQNHSVWAAMITGCSQHGHEYQALKLFNYMQERDVKVDKVLYLSVLRACCGINCIWSGWMIHDQILRDGYEKDLNIGSALVDMYAKMGDVSEAQVVFDTLPNKNVVSWGSIISGCVEHGYDAYAIMYYERMLLENVEATRAVFLCLLRACGNLRNIKQGQLVHFEIMCSSLELDTMIETTLLSMYIKCGATDEMHNHESRLLSKDEVAWNVVIAGCNECGHELLALNLFEKMLDEGAKPDNYTYSALLQACRNTCAIVQGRYIHGMVVRNSFDGDDVIRGTLVDMYARCGSLQEAEKVFNGLPRQDIVLWGALIGAYANMGDLKMCLQHFNNMRLQGLHVDNYTLSSMLAACSRAGEVDQGYKLFEAMTNNQYLMPNVFHVNSIADLFARTGHLDEATKLAKIMPLTIDVGGRMGIMNACQAYGPIDIGRQQFEQNICHKYKRKKMQGSGCR